MPGLKTSLTGTLTLALAALAGCASAPEAAAPQAVAASAPVAAASATDQAQFERDREAILAMAGDYEVSFDFTETVPLMAGYDVKEPKLSGGYEVVRVVEDRGDFISMQHILVVGGEQKFPVKHWRQDWQYEPERVLVFIGGNAWEWRDVPADERKGAWSQTVYQVDDAPRYGAVARWTYENGIAEWTPPAEWRPLPRRDMTTRDDYHTIDAVNRHVITPWGWVHEQDNEKLVLGGKPQALVREIGVNTYRRDSDFDVAVATEYWDATADYWAGVREAWAQIEASHERFAITIKGETEALYLPLLGYGEQYGAGEIDLETALAQARETIDGFVTDDIGRLADRLRPSGEMELASAD